MSELGCNRSSDRDSKSMPPQLPELNPIELVWNTMVQRLKGVPLQELYDIEHTVQPLHLSKL